MQSRFADFEHSYILVLRTFLWMFNMSFLFSFLCLLSTATFSMADQPLALEKKIQDLEKELDDMRFQSHVEQRVYGDKKPAKLIPVEAQPRVLKLPENKESTPQDTTVKFTKQPEEITPVETTPEETIEAPEPVEPILSEEHELYNQGRHYLAQQRLDLARKAFDDVIEKHDGTPESILARFWIGEFMLRTKNYPGASIALGQAYGALKKAQKQKGFSTDAFHGEENRLPEILAKLAYALKMINKRQDACITLRQLKKEYKKRPANLQWYINKLSKDLRCH